MVHSETTVKPQSDPVVEVEKAITEHVAWYFLMVLRRLGIAPDEAIWYASLRGSARSRWVKWT